MLSTKEKRNTIRGNYYLNNATRYEQPTRTRKTADNIRRTLSMTDRDKEDAANGAAAGGTSSAPLEQSPISRENGVDITAMVRSLQRNEGETDCFRRGDDNCSEKGCTWRSYCQPDGRSPMGKKDLG